MTSTTNHVDAAATSASAGVDGSGGGGGAGSGSGGDEVCSLSDNEFQKFLEDATTFNRPLSEASPLFRALLDRKNDDDDVAAVGGAEMRHLNSDCSHQTHRQRQNPRHRIPGTNPVSVSGGAGDGTCLDAVATSAVLRGAAARTTQGGSLQNLHVRPLAAERMEVDNSDDDGKERTLAPGKQTEEVDATVNFFLKPRVAGKPEDAKVLSRGEDKQTVQCLSNTGNSVTAAANKTKNQTRRVLSREVVSDEGYAPKHLDENGNPLGFDNHINQHSKTYPGSACNRSHLLPRVVSASDVCGGGGGLQHLDSDSNLSCTGALGLAGGEGNERGIRSKTRRPKPTAGKDNVTTAEKIPGHFWDDNIEVVVDFINSVRSGGGGGFGKETARQKGRKGQTPVNVRKEHQMVNGQQQHEAEEDADAEEEENAERKPRKKDKAKSKRQRMDANDRWSHLSDNSSASDDVGVVANEEEVADAGSDKMQEHDVVVKREVEVAPIPPQRLVPSDPESALSKVGDCSATTGSATAQEAESAEFRADFYAVAVSEIPPCLEDDFHVVTGKKHRRGRSAGNPSGGANPGSSSSSSRGRARNSDPGGERSRTSGDRDRDMMLWSGLHHYHRGHQRTSFGIGAGTDVDLRRKSTGSVPPSEHSSGDNSDIDSVHSLPVSSTTPKPSVDKTSASSSCTPHTSYADIARMASSSSASSSSCFPPIPPSQVPCVAAMDTERKEAQATTAQVVSAATSTVDIVARGGDIRDDDEAIMVVCGGGDTRFAVDDEASRTSTEPSSPATPVVVDTSLAALAMGPVTGPWGDNHSATPVVIIFADGLECENDSGRARAQVSFGFDVNEQLLRMTLSDGYLPEDVAGAPSSSSSSTADNVTVSVGFRFGQDPTIIGRDRNPLRETRWASYVPGKEGHRFNYVNVVNYIGQSWEIVRREMDGGSEGSIRYYSGDCM